MSSLPSTGPVTNAVVALVDAVGLVGDGTLPPTGNPPFAIVYPLPNGDFWGPDLVAPQAGAALDYQITIVDVSRAGAETFADIIRHALLDRDASGAFLTPMPVAGLIVHDRELLAYGGVVSERGVFNIADTFRIHVSTP